MSRKLTIVVDAPDSPSTEIDGQKAWHAHLWEGNKTAGERPDRTKGIQVNSINGPAAAVAYALDIKAHRP